MSRLFASTLSFKCSDSKRKSIVRFAKLVELVLHFRALPASVTYFFQEANADSCDVFRAELNRQIRLTVTFG